MANFQINGTHYESRMLDGEVQALVLKRLLPTLGSLTGVTDKIILLALEFETKSNGNTLKNPDATPDEDSELEENLISPYERLSLVLTPVARELSRMSDSDVLFIMNAAMQVTKRRAANSDQMVDVLQRNHIQIADDAAFKTRMLIAYHVLMENFGDMLGSYGVQLKGMLGNLFGTR